MIRNYRDRGTQSIAERRRVSKIPEDIQRRAQRKLIILNNPTDLIDLRIPTGSRLETLSGDREGQYRIRINRRCRICFVWIEGNAYQVEVVDDQQGRGQDEGLL